MSSLLKKELDDSNDNNFSVYKWPFFNGIILFAMPVITTISSGIVAIGFTKLYEYLTKAELSPSVYFKAAVLGISFGFGVGVILDKIYLLDLQSYKPSELRTFEDDLSNESE